MCTDSACSRHQAVGHAEGEFLFQFIFSGLKFVLNTDNESSQNEVKKDFQFTSVEIILNYHLLDS